MDGLGSGANVVWLCFAYAVDCVEVGNHPTGTYYRDEKFRTRKSFVFISLFSASFRFSSYSSSRYISDPYND